VCLPSPNRPRKRRLPRSTNGNGVVSMIGIDLDSAPSAVLRKLREWLRHRALAGVVLCFLTAAQSLAQFSSVPPKSAAPAPAPQNQISDPLGRSTPRGTIRGFVKAADRNDFETAVQYLQVPGKPKHETEKLARDLKELMNRYFSRPLALISDSPEGEAQDALPLDHQRVGSLKIGDKQVDVVMVRVTDPQSGRIWLISSNTLANVPELAKTIEENWIERFMPEPLLEHTLFSISLAQWIVWFASIALPFLFLYLASRITLVILKWIVDNQRRRALVEAWYNAVRGPGVFILTAIVHLLIMYTVGLSLTSRIVYSRFVLILVIIGVVWLLRRMMTLSFERVRAEMQLTGDTGKQSLILLAERLLRVVIILAAIFAILSILGVDTKTALAGVGIGGVAIAFGAQKTVENLLGGIFLLTDKALAIGDKCRIGERTGVVEDITLRSIRLRTAEQTLLSIPAGALSQSTFENFATRSKILIQTTLEVRYGTTTEQLRSILDGIRRLLAENPRLETETARVQLNCYRPNSIQLELFAYVRTRDEREFVAVREDLLLHIGEIIDASGSGFAMLAPLLYIGTGGESQMERKSVSQIQGHGWDVQEESRPPRRPGEGPRTQTPSLGGDSAPKRAS
jgi:MscS family membrane protein